MSDAQQQAEAPEQDQGAEDKQQEQTFTQADVDRIVRERVKREREKFADYDDLKAKAGEKATAEERLADIANAHGISAEDRDLFLTGTDEETLTNQAKRLAERESERKKRNNHVPNEGNNPRPADSDERQMVRQLFGRA